LRGGAAPRGGSGDAAGGSGGGSGWRRSRGGAGVSAAEAAEGSEAGQLTDSSITSFSVEQVLFDLSFDDCTLFGDDVMRLPHRVLF
ncbi:hypothetical protein CLOP_g7105, partial [Closterium sp. NIES-67]